MRDFLINTIVGLFGMIIGGLGAEQYWNGERIDVAFALGAVGGAIIAMALYRRCGAVRSETYRSLSLYLLGCVIGVGVAAVAFRERTGVALLNTQTTDALVYPVRFERSRTSLVDLSFIGYSSNFSNRYKTDPALIFTEDTKIEYAQIAARTFGQALRCTLTLGVPRHLFGTFQPPEIHRTRVELPLTPGAKREISATAAEGKTHPAFDLNPPDTAITPAWLKLNRDIHQFGQDSMELVAPINFIRTPANGGEVFVQWSDDCRLWLDSLRRESIGISLSLGDGQPITLQVPVKLQREMVKALCKLPDLRC